MQTDKTAAGKALRLAVVLPGDIHSDAMAAAKYGGLVDALHALTGSAVAVDSTLRGWDRLRNLCRAVHPRPSVWRERSYKNIPGFRWRSRRVRDQVEAGGANVVLQVGVLCDASLSGLPLFIYTDYTAALSGRRPEAGRSPFTPSERARWVQLEAATLSRARLVFSRSALVARSLDDDYAVARDRVRVVGGGSRFPPDDSARAAPPEPPLILFIGKDFRRKGGDIVLAAFRKVRSRRADTRLLMVTHAPRSCREALPGVTFRPPFTNDRLLASLYAEASMFVLPSRLETWGDVLLEAMAFGLPCIGVRGQPMEELIVDGQTGLLVEPEDPDQLAEAMQRLLDDPHTARRWGENGKRRVSEHYTWARVAEKIVEGIRTHV